MTDHGSSCRAGNSGVPRCDRSALPWKARRRCRAGSAGRLADDCDITSSAELARRASLLGANSVTARPTMGAAAAGRRCRDSVARRARHRHHPSGGRTDRGSFPTPNTATARWERSPAPLSDQSAPGPLCTDAASPRDRTVQKLLTQRQRAESGAVAVDESQVKMIEFGLADPSAIGEHELIQMRAIPAREGGINRLGEFAEAVRPRGGEYPSRPRPVVPGTAQSVRRCRRRARGRQVSWITLHFSHRGDGPVLTGRHNMRQRCKKTPPSLRGSRLEQLPGTLETTRGALLRTIR